MPIRTLMPPPDTQGRAARGTGRTTADTVPCIGSGVDESGYGREMGFEVVREYTTAKSVWVNVDAAIPPFYRR